MQQTERLRDHSTPRVAVIGAGISGLILARTLADAGVAVTVFEKSRGVGGRMATRRTQDGLRFDHGAQYFTVRDPRSQRFLNAWQADGIVQPWKGRIVSLRNGTVEYEKTPTNRFVAGPGMNAVCKQLGVCPSTPICGLFADGGFWVGLA